MQKRKVLPAELQPLWDALIPEVTWLHGRWIIYRQLFGTSPERIDMLNEAAATFFFVIQAVLLDEIQLTIGKLGDPAGTGKFRNLTLASMRDSVRALGHAELCGRLDILLADFDERSVQIRVRRNKRLAHYDLDTLLNGRSAPIETASRQEIEDALVALRKFVNEIEQHFTDSMTAYEHFILRDDGEALVATIKRGLRYEELAKERRIHWADLQESRYFRV
jgi:hypothetical protein